MAGEGSEGGCELGEWNRKMIGDIGREWRRGYILVEMCELNYLSTIKYDIKYLANIQSPSSTVCCFN